MRKTACAGIAFIADAENKTEQKAGVSITQHGLTGEVGLRGVAGVGSRGSASWLHLRVQFKLNLKPSKSHFTMALRLQP